MKLMRCLAAGAAALCLALSSANGLPPVAREAAPAAGAIEGGAIEGMPADAVRGPALWKLADEDTVIYLFGTVHVLPQGHDWFDARIESAFDSADELIFEIDIDDSARVQTVILERAQLAGERSLRELMAGDARERYEAALAGFGLPLGTFDRVEPWMAAMTLAVLPLTRAGYSTESGVETALNARAQTRATGALETIEEQIDLFATLPMEVQLAYLDETVKAMPRTSDKVGRMVAEWLKGDADTLAALMNEEMDDPELYRRLLTDRNANWAGWIAERMARPGTVFVAVGAGHLAGAESVQELLEARGFEVRRVWR